MQAADWIAAGNILVTAAAVIAAPIVALWISNRQQAKASTRSEKLRILGVLLSARHQPQAPDVIRSLNLIDAVSAEDREVRELWTRYFVALSDPNLQQPVGWAIWEDKRRGLRL